MPDEQKTQLRLEIAHVLFMDIVGYSKLLIDEQSEALQELNEIVRKTDAVRAAEAAGQLIFLPTGDGMALVFTGSVEEPVDCGDAGHILLSKRVADDLVQYRRWQPYLHELGDFEVKHGVVVSVVNLYADVVGNPDPPAKFKTVAAAVSAAPGGKSKRGMPWHEIVLALLVIAGLGAAGVLYFRHRTPQQKSAAASSPPPTAAAVSSVPEKSVAVLPFANLSANQENAFFTDGVQDQILTELARIADLKVISRTSVLQYKSGAARNLREIGQQLGVAHLVEGSVQRAANKVRVNAQLIDARTD